MENKDDVAFTIDVKGNRRDVSYKEVVIANNITLESLVTVLVNKGLITREELLTELNRLREEKYRAGEGV